MSPSKFGEVKKWLMSNPNNSILHSYIYIYMGMIYTKCIVVCIFFLLIYFAIYNYLLFFESDTSDFNIILYTCVSIQTLFHCFQKLKNKIYPFEEDASMCGLRILKKFLDVYFLPCGFFFELLRSCFLVF